MSCVLTFLNAAFETVLAKMEALVFTHIGPYDFRDAEKVDRIVRKWNLTYSAECHGIGK